MDTATTLQRCEVTILDTGDSIACCGGEPILKAMVTLGIKGIPSGCHGGGCGVCKIQIVSGRYRTEPMSREHVSATEERDGVALACRTYPETDMSVRVLGKLQEAVTRRRYGFV